MQSKWWLIAAGVIGIGLAVLLFPRPDTGGDVPSGDRSNTSPLDFKGQESQKPGLVKMGPDGRPDPRSARRELRPPDQRLGPNPIAADLAKRRSTPEAIYAGRASGPWTIVRRQLMLMPDDAEAKVVADEVAPLITSLRGMRRDPEAGGSYAELEQQQRAFLEKVRGHESWMADEVLVASLERVDGILEEYAAAGAAPGEAPATPDGAPAAAPTQEGQAEGQAPTEGQE